MNNNQFPSKTEVGMLRQNYPVGCRVRLDKIDDTQSLQIVARQK